MAQGMVAEGMGGGGGQEPKEGGRGGRGGRGPVPRGIGRVDYVTWRLGAFVCFYSCGGSVGWLAGWLARWTGVAEVRSLVRLTVGRLGGGGEGRRKSK